MRKRDVSAVSEAQLDEVVKGLVALASDSRIPATVRVRAGEAVLGHAWDYNVDAPAPERFDTPIQTEEDRWNDERDLEQNERMRATSGPVGYTGNKIRLWHDRVTADDLDALGYRHWPQYRKHVPTHAIRVQGPFTVETSEGPLRCEDGYLAVDARGYPYPIAADEFEKIYEYADEARTKPSPVVRQIDVDTLVGHATSVELLQHVLVRCDDLREFGGEGEAAGIVKRELSLAITNVEDAITRINKAHYRFKGTFAITDAERS